MRRYRTKIKWGGQEQGRVRYFGCVHLKPVQKHLSAVWEASSHRVGDMDPRGANRNRVPVEVESEHLAHIWKRRKLRRQIHWGVFLFACDIADGVRGFAR